MRIFQAFILLVACLWAPATFAADRAIHAEIYSGKVGDRGVMVEMVTYTNPATGRTEKGGRLYFHVNRMERMFVRKDSKRGITLRVEALMCKQTFSYALPPLCPIDANVTLKPAGDGAYTGTWRGVLPSEGDRKIALHRIDSRDFIDNGELDDDSALSHALWRAQPVDAYDDPKLDRHVHAGAVTAAGPLSYRMMSDDSGLKAPYLASAPDGGAMGVTNTGLRRGLIQMTVSHLECKRAGFRYGKTLDDNDWGTPQYDVAVSYASATLFQVTDRGESYCGGPHRTRFYRHRAYDLTTGKRLDLNAVFDLYSVDKAGKVTPSTAYRTLAAGFTATSPYALAGAANTACLIPADGAAYYDAWLDDQGLVFGRHGQDDGTDPRAEGCFGDYFRVPWSDLGGLWRKTASRYFRDTAKAP
ncbi:hypothetical protein [Asticcacaulis solisilvae]|uniref:hypothetical protein n=1 Tax=Asticcacaulis solisilvae TaxID=1217274 RepID=UPI003FD777A1